MSQTLIPGSILAMTDQAADRLLKLDSGDAALLYLHLLRRGSPQGLPWPLQRLQTALDQLKSVGLAPGEAALPDVPALLRAGVRTVLVRPEGGALPQALSGCGVALSAGDGGLLKRTDSGLTVRPRVLEALLDGGFLPVLTGGGEEAAAVAQAMKASRLVLFVSREPSLALGEDRQAELLHMDLAKAAELLKEGSLPEALLPAFRLACRGAEGGVKKAVLLSAGEPHILLLEALGQQVMGLSVTP